jgi:hypothetical protein
MEVVMVLLITCVVLFAFIGGKYAYKLDKIHKPSISYVFGFIGALTGFGVALITGLIISSGHLTSRTEVSYQRDVLSIDMGCDGSYEFYVYHFTKADGSLDHEYVPADSTKIFQDDTANAYVVAERTVTEYPPEIYVWFLPKLPESSSPQRYTIHLPKGMTIGFFKLEDNDIPVVPIV